ncbi:hypothetical protein OAV88_01935 [bacterium]|nr:hypothetical protein [bacterium]
MEVRDPPKYCSHCLGDSGECSVSTICNSDSDCNTITCNGATGGGTCGEVLPPYIYYARDANSPQSSCTSGTATNPPSSDCFVSTFEYNTCGDIVLDIRATGQTKLADIEAYGDLAAYFTVDQSTINTADIRGTLNFTDATPNDAGKTYRMCFKAVTCGVDVQTSYGGPPSCVDITFEDTQLSMSVSAPGDLDSCSDLNVLYVMLAA